MQKLLGLARFVAIMLVLAVFPVALLMAQQAPELPTEGVGSGLLLLAFGAATSLVMKGLRILWGGLDRAPSIVRSLLVSILGIGVGFLSTLLGIGLPLDPTGWDASVVNGILVALAAMGEHAVVKALTKGNQHVSV